MDLRRVTELHPVLELLVEPLVAPALLLDQRHLVAHADQAPRQVRTDLPPACDDDVHQLAVAAGAASNSHTASTRASIAVDVGQTVFSPSDA